MAQKTKEDRALESCYKTLPKNEYLEPLHQRESLYEALALSKRSTLGLSALHNQMLVQAIRDGRIGTVYSFTVPASVFVNSTLSMYEKTSVSMDLYTSFLPKPSDTALKEKTSLYGGSAARTRQPHTYEFKNYVPGDPKTVHVPMEQMTTLFALFSMIPYIANQYHEGIGVGENLIDNVISRYQKLSAKIRECDGTGLKTWSHIMDHYNGVRDGTPPWSPFLIEELREMASVPGSTASTGQPPRVVAYRFYIFFNAHLCKDRAGALNTQIVMDCYLRELRERLNYNSLCIYTIGEFLQKKKDSTAPIPGGQGAAANARQNAGGVGANGAGGGGGGANGAANGNNGGVAHGNPSINKIKQLIENDIHDRLKCASILLKTKLRSWEIPLVEATTDPYKSSRNPSTVLAMRAKEVLISGDNIHVPPLERRANLALNTGSLAGNRQANAQRGPQYHIPASLRAPTANNRHLIFSGLTSAASRQRQTNQLQQPAARPPAAAVRSIPAAAKSGLLYKEILESAKRFAVSKVHLILRPQEFDSCYYLPASDLEACERQNNGNPVDSTDPRRLENIFNVCNGFSSFVCTSVDQRQNNIFAYFDIANDLDVEAGGGIHPRDFPPYVISSTGDNPVANGKRNPHDKWHSFREEDPAITYGGLVNRIPEKYGLSCHTLYQYFSGFPDFIIENESVTLVLPSLQPWEFNMLPLPDVIRTIPMCNLAAELIQPLVTMNSARAGQYLTNASETENISLACLYMISMISADTINVDAKKYGFAQTPSVLRTDISSDTRAQDIQRDMITVPATPADLDMTHRNIMNCLEARIKSARYNINLRERLQTRITWETNQPIVRQPNEEDDGRSTSESLAIETITQGLDVFYFGGDVAVARNNLINEMCGEKQQTGTSTTEIPRNLSADGSETSEEALAGGDNAKTRRYQAKRILQSSLEEIGLRLLMRCVRMPHQDDFCKNSNVGFMNLLDRPSPNPWLPMPKPISMIFNDYNKKNSAEKWASFKVASYCNTSPLDEMFSYQAQTASSRYKIFSGIDTYLLLLISARSSLLYSRSLNAVRLHVYLAGDTATGKSYILRILKRLLLSGVVMGSNYASEKADTMYDNNNCHVDIREETDILSNDPNKSNARKEEAQNKWKEAADTAQTIYYYFTSNDPSLASTDRHIRYRRRALALGLLSNVFMWASNLPTKNIPVACLQRVLLINPPLNTDNAKALPGSQLTDMTLHNVDAFSNMETTPFRVRHFYHSILRIFCFLNPRFQPDVTDALNFIGEVLRRAKVHLPKDIHENRRYGRIGLILETICYENATHMALRDLFDDQAKYAPCEANSEYLTPRHINIEAFLARAVRYLYATKEQAIMSLTLLKDVLESPIRTAMLEYFAQQCYPNGSLNHSATEFKTVRGEYAMGPNGYPEKEDDRTDFNYVVINTTQTDKQSLYRELGKKISTSVAYSPEQIEYVMSLLCQESIELDPSQDNNLPTGPNPIETDYIDDEERKRDLARKRRVAKVTKKRTAQPDAMDVIQGIAAAATTAPTPEPAPTTTTTTTTTTNPISREQLAEALTLMPNAAAILEEFAPNSIRRTMGNKTTGNQPQSNFDDPALDNIIAQEGDAIQKPTVRYFPDKIRIKEKNFPFQCPVVALERGDKYWRIQICHEVLRKFYRVTGDQTSQAKAKQGGPFPKSHIWRKITEVLQSASLESYPDFITDKVATDVRFNREAREEFTGGSYTYLTGRVDAINEVARPLLQAVKAEVKTAFATRKKLPPPVPETLPTRWLIRSPPIKRPTVTAAKKARLMTLSCLMDDSPIDKAYVFGDTYESLDVSRTTSSKQRYDYDLDYVAKLRRCIRLGWDITTQWDDLPIICRLKKLAATHGTKYYYPMSSIESHVNRIREALLDDTETDYGDLDDVDPTLDDHTGYSPQTIECRPELSEPHPDDTASSSEESIDGASGLENPRNRPSVASRDPSQHHQTRKSRPNGQHHPKQKKGKSDNNGATKFTQWDPATAAPPAKKKKTNQVDGPR